MDQQFSSPTCNSYMYLFMLPVHVMAHPHTYIVKHKRYMLFLTFLSLAFCSVCEFPCVINTEHGSGVTMPLLWQVCYREEKVTKYPFPSVMLFQT